MEDVKEAKSSRRTRFHEKTVFVLRQVLAGPKSSSELVKIYQEKYGVPRSTSRAAISEALSFLLEHGVIAVKEFGERGTKILDITPSGIHVLLTCHGYVENLPITLGEIIEALRKRGFGHLEPFIALWCKLVLQGSEAERIPAEEGDEELIECISYEAELGAESPVKSWDDLYKTLLEEIIEKIEELLEKEKLFNLREHVLKNPYVEIDAKRVSYKDVLPIVLESVREDLKEKIDALKRKLERVEELLTAKAY